MLLIRISFGHTASHSPSFEQAPKPSDVHLFHHPHGAPMLLGLPLRQQVQVGDLGRREQRCRGVLAGRDARAALDAGRGVEGRVSHRLGHRDGVGIGSGADVHRDIAAGAHDPIERRAIDDEILHDGEGRRPPRFDRDGVAVAEPPHVQLAHGGARIGAVRDTVDHAATGAADPFTTVRVERNRFLTLADEPLVDDIEHLEERHVWRDVVGLVLDQPPRGFWCRLPPHAQCQIQCHRSRSPQAAGYRLQPTWSAACAPRVDLKVDAYVNHSRPESRIPQPESRSAIRDPRSAYLYDRWLGLTYSNESDSTCRTGTCPTPVNSHAAACAKCSSSRCASLSGVWYSSRK